MSYKITQKTQQKNILQQQIHLLSEKGPPLGLFACNHQSNSIFTIQTITHHQQQVFLKLKTNFQSNIRVFYYLLLYHIYELQDKEQSNRILLIFKRLAYSEKTKIDLYPKDQIQPKFREIYTDTTLKKILVEFLQVLSYCHGKGRIVKMLTRYPIIDFVLTLFLRTTLHQKQMTCLQSPIDLNHLVRWFYENFKIQSIHIKDNKYFFPKSKMTIEEGQEFTIIFEDNSLQVKSTPTACDNKLLIQNFHNLNFNEQISTEENTPQFKILVSNHKTRKHSDYSFENQQTSHKEKVIDEEYDDQEQTNYNRRHQKKGQNINFDTFSNFNFNNNNKRQQSPYEKLNEKNLLNEGKEQKEKSHLSFGKENSQNDKSKQKSQTSQDTKTLIKETNIYDGLTSLDILKFMSPDIKKTIDTNKKKSLLDLLGKTKPNQNQKSNIHNHRRRFHEQKQKDQKIELRRQIPDDIKLQKNRIESLKQKQKVLQYTDYSNNKSVENIVKPQSSKVYFQQDRTNKYQNVNHTYQYQTKSSNYYKNHLNTYSPRPTSNQIIYYPQVGYQNITSQGQKYFAKPSSSQHNIALGSINYVNKFNEIPRRHGQMNTQTLGNNLNLRFTHGNIYKPKY